MKILMIGMNGFLGRNLSEIIKHENFEILSLVRKINFKPKIKLAEGIKKE